MNNNFHISHDLFFKEITENQLKELYRRADPNTKELENDINTRLTNTYCEVNINNECHIFINYFDNNNKKIGHFSLHIEPKDKSLSQKAKEYGRFHISNNKPKPKSSQYTLKINRNPKSYNSRLYFSYNTTKFMRNELKSVVDTTIQVLHYYFNKNHILSITKYNKSYKSNCIQTIKKKMKLRTTPKSIYKISNQK
jgi:hypothetical protein